MNILVVDDNHDAADSLAMLLTIWGYNVRVAYDGAEALEATADFRPDCIFLDINMPIIDGCAVARHLRRDSLLMGVPLIALTAYSDNDRLKRILDAGFNFYLRKPAEPTVIEHLVKGIGRDMRIPATQDAQLHCC